MLYFTDTQKYVFVHVPFQYMQHLHSFGIGVGW